MSIPAKIVAEWDSLQQQVASNTPLSSASRATRVAIKLNAAQLVSDLQDALIAPAKLLDAWVASSDPDAIVNGILSVCENASDQDNLSLLRGIAGRAAANLDQLPS